MAGKNKVQWVYESSNNQELEERYDQWAAEYDQDLVEDFAWNGPQSTAQLFSKLVPKSARVLDAGAGTGLVGEALSQLGYNDIVATFWTSLPACSKRLATRGSTLTSTKWCWVKLWGLRAIISMRSSVSESLPLVMLPSQASTNWSASPNPVDSWYLACGPMSIYRPVLKTS